MATVDVAPLRSGGAVARGLRGSELALAKRCSALVDGFLSSANVLKHVRQYNLTEKAEKVKVN